MSRFAPLNRLSFAWIALPVLVTAGSVLAVSTDRLSKAIDRRAQKLAAEAKAIETSDPSGAIYRYQIASTIEPKPEIVYALADLYLRQDKPDVAVAALERLSLEDGGERIAQIQLDTGQLKQAAQTIDGVTAIAATASSWRLKSRILMESGRGGEAIDAAKKARSYALEDASLDLQLGLAFASEGKTEELGRLIASVRASEAARTLSSAATSKLGLAKTLYAQSLLKSAERALNAQPIDSTEGAILLAEIKLAPAHPSQPDLLAARDALQKGLERDPASLDLHRMALKVYLRLGDDSGVAREREQIKALESGRV